MNFDFLKNEEFLKAKEEKKHFFFGKVDLPLFTWDDVIPLFQNNVDNPEIFDPKTFNNCGFRLHDASPIEVVNSFQQELSKISSFKINSHIYISFTNKSETLGFHKDDVDVIFWQVFGRTEFIVIDHQKPFKYNMEPGDVLFIPKKMTHNTKPLECRFAVSLAF